ncbi:hypothetical protein EIP91_003200 [Steccherinum ochraceum]|uniref:Uncharacterized protein n=1 Tax=Steccherinum ochraceum TaxID=92696 RepID=A0A4V2MXX2_9APHY|nr:hypothetical protein EIP91_003200 [Steccherinum ochraceum]
MEYPSGAYEPKRESVSSEGPYVGGLEAVFESTTRRAQQYEVHMKDLEGKLAEDLSNSRAIENYLREVIQGLEHTQQRSHIALSSTVPQITHSLRNDLSALEKLGDRLPEVGRQIRDIRHVYDSGRVKATDLMSSLEWLNTPVPLRLRTIIFTSQAPVSARVKALIRFLFALVFLACAWIAWIALRGALRRTLGDGEASLHLLKDKRPAQLHSQPPNKRLTPPPSHPTMPFTISAPAPLLPKCPVVSLAEAQVRSDIRYRSLRQPSQPLTPPTSYIIKPKPILDFDSHKLETTLIPRSMALQFDEIRFRGL